MEKTIGYIVVALDWHGNRVGSEHPSGKYYTLTQAKKIAREYNMRSAEGDRWYPARVTIIK